MPKSGQEDFKKLGLGGFMSCQNQRVFMPHGLGMNVMGNALWTGKAGFEDCADAYFSAAYGPDGSACKNLMETLSDFFDPTVLCGETPVRSADNAARYAQIPGLIDVFMPTIERNLEIPDPVQRHCRECLAFYVSLCRKLAKVEYAAACGAAESMEEAWMDARIYVCENELRFQREFDVFEFLNIWESKILVRFRRKKELDIE